MLQAAGTPNAIPSPASKVHPHPTVSFWNIPTPANGNNAPPRLLNTVFAAMALAAYPAGAKISTRYVNAGMKTPMRPRPTKDEPAIGANKEILGRASQPYSSRPVERRMQEGRSGRRRSSGGLGGVESGLGDVGVLRFMGSSKRVDADFEGLGFLTRSLSEK
jgi:hypothetical protein